MWQQQPFSYDSSDDEGDVDVDKQQHEEESKSLQNSADSAVPSKKHGFFFTVDDPRLKGEVQ